MEDRRLPSAYSIQGLPLNPADINARGQVVGAGGNRAVLWQDGSLIDLGSLAGPGGTSTACAINDAGQVVGRTQVTPGLFSFAAFLITPEDVDRDGSPDRWFRDDDQDGVNDLMIRLGGFPGVDSVARDINEAGHVVGNSGYRAVLWRDGNMIDLGWDTVSSAYGINDAGQVVGFYEKVVDSLHYGTKVYLLTPEDTDRDGTPDRWYRDTDSNSVNDLMVELGSSTIYSTAITSDGRVVWWDGYIGAMLWTPDVPNGTVGSLMSLGYFVPVDINTSGVVVGDVQLSGSSDEPGTTTACLWNGTSHYLSELIPADSWYSLDITPPSTMGA